LLQLYVVTHILVNIAHKTSIDKGLKICLVWLVHLTSWIKIVKYLTLSFWKKVWFTFDAICRKKNLHIVSRLSIKHGIHITMAYPRILPYIVLVKISGDVNVELINSDLAAFSRMIPEYSLDPIAVLNYNIEKDDLIPLVLRFTNPETCGKILITVIYDKNLGVVGVCIYNPENNLLALKYLNGNKLLIRVGVSKIDSSDNEKWFYNNYFLKDGVIILNSNPEKQGRIWFTSPFSS
jgi:hypothetical protein